MSAVEEIQAAILTLTEYKARGYSVDNGWLIEIDCTITPPDDPRSPLTNDDYMVTLHRTIDAQLAILEDFAHRYQNAWAHWTPAGPGAGNTLALARAINGATA